MRVLLTVNAAWNIWNFRRDLVASLVGDGHAVTILAPPDDTVPLLEALGARFVPLPMKPDGLGPLEGLRGASNPLPLMGGAGEIRRWSEGPDPPPL